MRERGNKFKYLHLHLSIYIPRGGAFDLFATMLKFGTHKRNGGREEGLERRYETHHLSFFGGLFLREHTHTYRFINEGK